MTEAASTTVQPDESATMGKASKRPRGVGFPSMGLEDAVSTIKKIAGYGKNHSTAAVASFLGHSTSNSGPFRSKIAALRDYGFITGRGDELNVTPLASEIVYPSLDADLERSLRAAFFECAVFRTVYESLEKGRSLDVEQFANNAMHNHGVAPQSKDAFAASFIMSGTFAGLIHDDGSGHITLVEGREQSAAGASEPSHERTTGTQTSAKPAAPSYSTQISVNAAVNHSWLIAGGSIRFVIESTEPLPATAYAKIGEVISVGDQLASTLKAEVTDDRGNDSD